MIFALNLDDNYEALYHEMELIQDGGSGHIITMNADTVEEAAKELTHRLTDFFEMNMYELTEEEEDEEESFD